jgi:hypothetical protein
MRAAKFILASAFAAITAGLGLGQSAVAQRHELPPPPPTVGLPGARGGDVSIRLFELRDACRAGDRSACVRFGILIGENRERVAEWRREHPELFFYEEEGRRR